MNKVYLHPSLKKVANSIKECSLEVKFYKHRQVFMQLAAVRRSSMSHNMIARRNLKS
jgi:hypothetical protein